MKTIEKINIIRDAVTTTERLMDKNENKNEMTLIYLKEAWKNLQHAHLEILIQEMEEKLEPELKN